MFGGGPTSLEVPADDPLFKRIAAGGHPDLVTLERVENPKTGRSVKVRINDRGPFSPYRSPGGEGTPRDFCR